jgi:Peptidase propeptide and YPEB domain
MIKRMQARKAIVALGVGAVLALGAGGAAIAQAGGDDGENSAKGPQADQARAAALKLTNGGTANAVERDSENGATWEVEVTKPDGKTVDVRLDQDYKLVVIEGDSESHDTGK